ncbi:MAG: ADP-ribosylglycohydrolase family protein [Streptococcus sp.]|nr:ADP-ribosylglycohydrolase family protein [Streptococcus sp.]
MLGAIIGDIAGSKYEFNNTFDYDFEMFGEGCDFTDDTICTVAITDAILNGRSYQESLLDWCRRYPSPKGAYGGRFAGWIRSLDPQPYNSFGNGSAMRVSPVAWLFDDLSQVLEEAEKSALPTHNHPEGIKGAKAVAHAIWHFRKSKFSEESKEWKDEKSKEYDKEYDAEAMKAFKNIARSYYEDFDIRDYPKGKFDETCMDAVPLSFHLLSQASSFEDAIRLAISHGGDSDTIGAIVGSIAEARFGIPQEIKDRAMEYLPDDMKDVLKQFAGKYEIKPK